MDYIVHAAAPTSNKIFCSEPVEALKVIIDGTQNILELAREHMAVMVYISSEEVYGTSNSELPLQEDYIGAIDSLSVRNCYPLGKKAAELFCRSYCEEYGLDVKIIRPTVILGLWQDYASVKVEAEILRCIMENKNLLMKSDGSTKKCVIYTMDAVSAILTVLFKGKKGEAYNATNPDTFCSVRERAYEMFQEFNPNVTIDFEAIDNSVSQGYLPKRSLLEDIGRLEALGWKPYADMYDIYKIDMERFAKKHYAEGSNNSIV